MSTETRRKTIPTEDAPERGVIELFGVPLSHGVRWEHEGDHVFSSTEFDVCAAGKTFEEGLRAFGRELLAFAVYLSELSDPAENEVEMLRGLQPRVLEIARRAQAEVDEPEPETPKRLRTATRARRGDHNGSRWHPTSRNRRSSAKLSHA